MKNHYIYLLILLLPFIAISCKSDHVRGGSPKPEPVTPGELNPETPIDVTVKIYYENTLSMDGYITGNTDFKDVFRELLVAVENENRIDFETEFYLVNDKLTKTNFQVATTKISEELTVVNAINAHLKVAI